MRYRRIGFLSLGVIFIASGLALLQSTINGTGLNLIRYWPVILILLGLETLVVHAQAQARGQSIRLGLSGWALIAMVLLLALGTSAPGSWTIGCWPFPNWGSGSPFSERVTERHDLVLPLDGVTVVEVESQFGHIELLSITPDQQPGGQATVTGSGRTESAARTAAAAAGASVERVGSRLVIRATGEHSGGSVSTASVNIELRLPPGLEVRVSSEYGSITVAGLVGPANVTSRFGNVSVATIGSAATVETTHGNVTASSITGPLTVRSTYGNIDCVEITGSLNVVSRHGQLSVRRAHGEVRAESTYGRISVVYDQPPAGRCEATTVHGAITVELPASSAVTIDAISERAAVSTNLSEVNVQPEGRGNRAAGEVNGGGSLVRLRTEYARIEIRGR